MRPRFHREHINVWTSFFAAESNLHFSYQTCSIYVLIFPYGPFILFWKVKYAFFRSSRYHIINPHLAWYIFVTTVGVAEPNRTVTAHAAIDIIPFDIPILTDIFNVCITIVPIILFTFFSIKYG